MKSILSKIMSIVLALSMITFYPARLRADSPAGFAAVAALWVVGGAVTVYAGVSSLTSETTETDNEGTETTSTSESDTGGDDESSGENESTESITGGKDKPLILTDTTRGATWYESSGVTAVYGKRVPASEVQGLGRQSDRKAGGLKTVAGGGVEYRVISDAADVLSTAARIRKVKYTKTRRTTLKLFRKGAVNRATVVPVRIAADELRATTKDLAGSIGNSSITLRAIIDGKTEFELTASVVQGSMPTFSGVPAGATLEQRNDYAAVHAVSQDILVPFPKGKRVADLELVLITSGEGRKS